MSRTMNIAKGGISCARRFITEKNIIKCAFDLEKFCTPDCAACEYNTHNTQATCMRKDFLIGYVKED